MIKSQSDRIELILNYILVSKWVLGSFREAIENAMKLRIDEFREHLSLTAIKSLMTWRKREG